MANILVKHEPEDKVGAEYHWQRSFTDGDANFVNQLWYARQLYINDKFDDYLKLINKLQLLRIPPKTRHKVRGLPIDSGRNLIKLTGKCVRKEATYAIIESAKYRGSHFLHKDNCPKTLWNGILIGADVGYHLGFTFSGAAAVIARESSCGASDTRKPELTCN